MRRLSLELFIGGALLVLLAVLATLQYRWLGEVSNAERDRLATGLRTRTSEFVQEFDSELTRLQRAFHVDADRPPADPVGTLEDAYARWKTEARAPGLMKDIYLVDRRDDPSHQLRRLDLARHAVEPVEWPSELRAWLRSERWVGR